MDDEIRRRVRVRMLIMSQKYEITCDAKEEEELLNLAKKLESKLLSMQDKINDQSNPSVSSSEDSSERLAVVYALNLMRKTERLKRYLKTSESRLEFLVQGLEDADGDIAFPEA